MSVIDPKLCKICLSSNTDTGLSSITCLTKFLIHVLGIHEPPSNIWLCNWCTSVLRKTAKLIKLAEESQSFLSNMKMKNTTHYNFNEDNRNNLFNLSVHHNNHNDIEPTETRSLKTNKPKKSKKNKIQFIDMNESNNRNINDIKVKNEDKVEVEIMLEEVKIETVEMDEPLHTDDRLSDRNDDISEEQSKRKVNQQFYEKCQQKKFILKVLTLEEQIAELEEKKKSEKYLSRKYKCEYCGIGFVTKDVFEQHTKKHQESHSPHECKICHLRFSTSLVLSQHSLAHQRRFHCQLCSAVISRYSDCENHRRKCGHATPGVCSHCKKIFSNQSSLEQHIRGVHYKKEKKFACTFCNQRFQSKQRLDIHTRTHTGAKPYTCDLCHRSFAANSNLRYHLSAHAQARPHYCVECDKSYKTRKGLRRHLLEGATHRGKNLHSCPQCLKNFASEKLLAAHVSSVHTNPDSCGLCDKTFSTSANLKKHVRSAHESSIK